MQRLDLRLGGAATGAWVMTLACLHCPGQVAAGLVIGAVVLALTVLRLRRCWSPAVVLLLVGIAAAGACTGLRVHARDDGPVAALAGAHAVASVSLVVTDDPRPLAQAVAGGPQTFAVPARLVSADSGGETVTARAAVLVLAQDERWRDLLPSQRVQTRGRLAPPRGGDLTAAVLSARGPPTLTGRPSVVQRAAGRLRAGLRTACSPLPTGPRGLLPGLVVGDTSRMDPELTADFRTTGLTHLVAVSGTNCAIVAGAVLLVLRRVRAGPRLAAAGAGLALVGFVVLVRPSPSVLRAAVMGGIALLALASGRGRSALPALSASIVCLLLYDPALAGSAGFALSVLATAGLLLVAPTWRDALHRRHLPRGVAESLAIPAAAQVACAPVLAVLSAQVSIVSVPANLLAAPAVAPATILGVLAALVSPVSPPAAGLLARLGGFFTQWLVTVAQHGAAVPEGVLPWPGGRRGGLLLAAVLVVGALLLRHRTIRRSGTAAATAVLLVTAGAHAVSAGWPPPGWVLVACDVGQGDGLAVDLGHGAAMVVDTGTDPTAIDQCLRALRVRDVPLVVLTHFHADHVGGLAGVLRGRQVGAVLSDSFHEPTGGWQHVQQVARAAHVPLQQVQPGEHLDVGPMHLEVLGPVREVRGSRSDPNNNSVVMRVTESGRRILFTGDADVEEQQSLLQAGVDVRADVLKEPHHGSGYVDPTFLQDTRASVSVISVGAHNDYGQPAARALDYLRQDGMRVLRTDQLGDVALSVRGGSWTWSAKHTHRPPRPIGGPAAGALPAPPGSGRATATGRPTVPAVRSGAVAGGAVHCGAVDSGVLRVSACGPVQRAPPNKSVLPRRGVLRATMRACWRPWCSSSVRSCCSSTARSTRPWRGRVPPTRT